MVRFDFCPLEALGVNDSVMQDGGSFPGAFTSPGQREDCPSRSPGTPKRLGSGRCLASLPQRCAP